MSVPTSTACYDEPAREASSSRAGSAYHGWMTEQVSPSPPQEQGLLSKISTEVVRTLKDSFGKGPLKAKSYMLDDFLIVVMRGGVTVAEQTMLDRGHSDLVRAFRQTYQNELGDELVAKIEVLTGRKVVNYQSQILFEPHIVMEIFFFDDTADPAQIARESRRPDRRPARRRDGVGHQHVGPAPFRARLASRFGVLMGAGLSSRAEHAPSGPSGPERIRFHPLPMEVIRADTTASRPPVVPRVSPTRSRRDRDALVERYLPLARSLARRYLRGAEPLEDLEQVASLALVKAVEGFDPSRDAAFSSYAVPTITGALKRHYRDYGWSVRVPRDLQELAMRIQRFNETASATTGTSPTAAQIAEHAGISVEDVIEARQATQALHADSLDQPRPLGATTRTRVSLLDTMGTPDTGYERTLDRVTLDSLLETLEERDQAIVRLYHQEELTQAEIGRAARLFADAHLAAAPAGHREAGRRRG